MIDLNARLEVERLGARGEGVSRGSRGLIFTPFALPGETIRAEVDGDRGKLVEVLNPSPDRVPAPCPHFTKCGGCAVQTLSRPAYESWKRGLVADALRNAGVEAEIAPLVAAWGAGRRRATFQSRRWSPPGAPAGVARPSIRATTSAASPMSASWRPAAIASMNSTPARSSRPNWPGR
jgi:23S rRNA (uracil1939-C5)-methyltransferase